MNIYPKTRYAIEDYHAEMEKHIHDRMSSGLVEVLWHGTVEYQRFIERDGQEHQRSLLAQIHAWRDGLRNLLTNAEASWPVLLSSANKMAGDAVKLSGSKYQFEHKKAAYLSAKAKEHRKIVTDSTAAAEGIKKRIATLDNAASRLATALLYFSEHPPQRAEAQQPPAPIFNIHVEPTPITVEAIIPAVSEVAITSMPQRLTEVTVHRDNSGDVAGSVQVEKDL